MESAIKACERGQIQVHSWPNWNLASLSTLFRFQVNEDKEDTPSDESHFDQERHGDKEDPVYNHENIYAAYSNFFNLLDSSEDGDVINKMHCTKFNVIELQSYTARAKDVEYADTNT